MKLQMAPGELLTDMGVSFTRAFLKNFRSVNEPKNLMILVSFAKFDPFVVHVRVQKSSQKKVMVERDGYQNQIF